MGKSFEDILLASGVCDIQANATVAEIREFIASQIERVESGRLDAAEAYAEIENNLSRHGLSMHDLVDYPEAEEWEKGFDLISDLIADHRNHGERDTEMWWLADEICGEKAHVLVVATFAQVTEQFLEKLQQILTVHLPQWFIAISSEAPDADYRIYVRSTEITRKPLSSDSP